MALEPNPVPSDAIFKQLAWLAALCGWDEDENTVDKKPWLQRDEKYWADVVLLNLSTERAEFLKKEVRALLSTVGGVGALGLNIDNKKLEMMQPSQRRRFQDVLSMLPTEVVPSIFNTPSVDPSRDRPQGMRHLLAQIRKRLENILETHAVSPCWEVRKIASAETKPTICPTYDLCTPAASSTKKLRNSDLGISENSVVAAALRQLRSAQSDPAFCGSASYFARVDHVARNAVLQLGLLQRKFACAAESQNVSSPSAYTLPELEVFARRTLSHIKGEEVFQAFAGPRSVPSKSSQHSCQTRCGGETGGTKGSLSQDQSNTIGHRNSVGGNREFKIGTGDSDLDTERSLTTSLIGLKYPAIIPGGRFTEIYYWDSFWVVKGLCAIGSLDLAANIIGNLLALIDTFGFVPNGTRTYYLDRSQPPVLAAAVQSLVEAYLWQGEVARAAAVAAQCLPRLLIEYCGFWMNPSTGHLVKLQVQEPVATISRDDTTTSRMSSYDSLPTTVVTATDIPDPSSQLNVIFDVRRLSTRSGLSIAATPVFGETSSARNNDSVPEGGRQDQDTSGTPRNKNDPAAPRTDEPGQMPRSKCSAEQNPEAEYFLNRYWSWRTSPRLESFVCDASLAAFDALSESSTSNSLLRDVRAAAESGWDFSCRWCTQYIEGTAEPLREKCKDKRIGSEDGGNVRSSTRSKQASFLRTIRTTEVVPVDLNALLYLTEVVISQLATFILFHFQSNQQRPCSQNASSLRKGRLVEQEESDSDSDSGPLFLVDGAAFSTQGQEALLQLSKEFRSLACARRHAMLNVMWDSNEQVWRDFYLPLRQRSAVISAASLFPLWVGLGPADSMNIHHSLLSDGWQQLPTATTALTGQQWDWPYVWPPLIDVAVSHCLDPLVHIDECSDSSLIISRRLGSTSPLFELGVSTASRFIATVVESFERDGVFWEKYPPPHLISSKGNSCVIGGGEYSNQVGFGWTNAVFLSLIGRLGSGILKPDRLDSKEK